MVRVLVPAGFMPAHDPGRFLAVVLCSGSGPVEGVLDLFTGEAHKDGELPTRGDEHDAPCVFAAGAQVGAPAASSPEIFARVGVRVDAPALAARGATPGLAAPPPQATAPPGAA
jgi:hypothetical protein